MNKFAKLSLLAILLVSLTFAQEVDNQEEDDFLKEDPNMLFGDFNEQNLQAEAGDRVLASYPKMRIYSDLTYLTEGSEAFLEYAKNQLIPAVTDYIQSAVSNKYPLASPIKSTSATTCGYETTQALKDGVDADLFVLYNSKVSTGTWVAAATSCMVSTGVRRPTVIVIGINAKRISTPTIDSPISHDLNINYLIHEYIHGLALIAKYFNYFVDSNGKPLTGHVKKVTLSGKTRTVLDLPPLTTRLRNFYGCSTVPGYFLSSSAHPFVRFLQWDVMATGGVTGSKVSQFSLGILEGTGWYAIDYDYAEPYFFGQGQGCQFYSEGLGASSFEEYCTGTGMGCTDVGDSGGYCIGPSAMEGYRIISSQPLLNCDNPKGVYYTPFASKQVYGRGLGSRCFTGNLATKTAGKTTSYCLKYTCSGSGISTKLTLNWGTTELVCTQKGPLTVPGYVGQIDCPDPLKYCETTGVPFCRRNCMGRGRCVSGQCICNSGYQGSDCAYTI